MKIFQEQGMLKLAQDIESIFDLETELFPCLVDMRFLGVRVDIQAAHALKQELVQEEPRQRH